MDKWKNLSNLFSIILYIKYYILYIKYNILHIRLYIFNRNIIFLSYFCRYINSDICKCDFLSTAVNVSEATK